MRQVFVGILVLMCVLLVASTAVANNPMGIADKYEVTFPEKVLIAGTMLPKGNYQIDHVMEGSDHIMVFHQLGVKKPAEVRAKCTLVPLGAKATQDQKTYVVNAANERVLQQLVFKGDLAAHVF